MQIDRSRFLLLTATLAVSACNKKAEEPKPDADKKAAEDKQAAEPAAKEEPAAEPEAAKAEDEKVFGIKGAPDPGPDGDALPPVVPEPEDNSAPAPLKE